MGTRSPSPEQEEHQHILGTLYLVGKHGHRKNADLQSYPIDTDLVTIGREENCDVRLYWPDVSKIHCEIRFDLQSSTANLLILGSNPVLITPAHNPSLSVAMSSGEAHQLQTNDTFTIRKKTFRFEYAADNRSALQPVIENTPMKKSALVPQEKRRGSYRLSLVPEGKRFVPLPSNLGLPETPRKSVAAAADAASSDEEEESVEVVEGDNNDKIYLEPQPQSHVSAFRTPMKSAMKPTVRHTDAVPRTRKVEIMHTPVRAPNSLRKALLMRSARKVLATTAIPQVELDVGPEQEADMDLDFEIADHENAELENEDAEHDDANADQEEDEFREGFDGEMYDEAEEHEHDEVEADMSLDEVPDRLADVFARAQHETELSSDNAEGEDEHSEEEQASEAEEDHGEMSHHEHKLEDEHELAHEHELVQDHEYDHDHEQDLVHSEEISDEDEEQQEEYLSDQNAEVDPASIPLPETPLPARYTSQVVRQPRKSLAEISGPPVRFERLPSTPSAHPIVERVPATPGTMGKASRRLVPSTPQPALLVNEWQDDEDESVDYKAERQRRRETLATPRALPLPPTSFRSPVRDAPTTPSMFFASPMHPALARQAPMLSTSPPATPMDALKQRMAALRLQSSTRRATVGFALPNTPASKPPTQSALFTGGRMRKVGPSTPFAPLVAIESLPGTPTPETVTLQDVSPQKVEEQLSDSAEEEEQYEQAEGQDQDESLDDEQLAAEYLVSEPSEGPSSPPTPSYSGLRDMLREPVQPPATPYFSGLRSLFASTPEQPATPQMTGLRELMKTPAPQPATPVFSGLRSLFAARPVTPATPVMNLDEVFEELGAQNVGIEAELEALSVKRDEEVAEMETTELEVEKRPQVQAEEVVEAHTRAQAEEVVEVQSQVEAEEAVDIPVPAAPARASRARRPTTQVTETKSEPIRRPRPVVSRVPRAAVVTRTRAAAPLEEVEPQPRVPVARATRAAKATPKAKEVEEKSIPSRIPKKLPARTAKPSPVPVVSGEPVRTTRARARA